MIVVMYSNPFPIVKNINSFHEISEDIWNKIESLDCSNNDLEKIDSLPPNLKVLNCSNNKLEELPKLPNKIEILYCHNNKLKSFPKVIPDSLHSIICYKNKKIFSYPNSKTLICFKNIKKSSY